MEFNKIEDAVVRAFLVALQQNDQLEFERLLSPEIHFTHNGQIDNIHQWAATFFFCDQPATFVSIDKAEAGTIWAQLVIDGLGTVPIKLSFTIVNEKVSTLDAGRQ
jgi:hypothetical protein